MTNQQIWQLYLVFAGGTAVIGITVFILRWTYKTARRIYFRRTLHDRLFSVEGDVMRIEDMVLALEQKVNKQTEDILALKFPQSETSA